MHHNTLSHRARLAGVVLAALLPACAVHAQQQPYYAAFHMPFGSSYSTGGGGGFTLTDFAGNNRVIASASYVSKGGSSFTSQVWDISDPSRPAVLTAQDTVVMDVDAAGQMLRTTRANPTQFTVGDNGLGGSGFRATSMNDHGVVVGTNNGLGYWYNVHTGADWQFQPDGYVSGLSSINNNGLVIGFGSSTFLYNVNTDQATVSSAGVSFLAINNANQLLVSVGSGGSTQLYLQNDPWAAAGSGINLSALPGAPTLPSLSPSNVRMNSHGQIIAGSWFFDGTQWLDMQTYFGPQGGKLTLQAISDSGEILAQFAPTIPPNNYYSSITTSYIFKPSATYLAVQFVPEPGSMALMGLGLAGVAWAARRRQRAGLARHA